MAIANPGLTVGATQEQDLFSVETTDSWREDVPGVPFYQPVDKITTVVTGFLVKQIGTDSSLDTDTGIIQLDSGFTFNVTARAFLAPNAKQTGTCMIVDADTDMPLSFAVPIGEIAISVVTTTAPTNVKFVVISDSSEWDYPSQIVNATFGAQVIDGFTVA